MKNWNSKYKYDYVPTIKGNDYEIGVSLGQIFHADYKALKRHYISLKNPRVIEYITWLLPFLRNNCKPAYDEICGRADGAKIDVKLLLVSLCEEEMFLRHAEHCTSILVSTKENEVLAHNVDGNYTKKNTCFVKMERRGGIAHYEIADSNSLSGSSIFVGKELVYCTNSLAFDDFDLKNVPTNMFFKMCSCCKNFAELMDVVKKTPITSACGLNVCDVPNKKFYYIEKVHDKYDLKVVNGINVHTNHILAKKFLPLRPERVDKTSTSLSRQTIVNGLIAGRKDLNIDEVYKVLTYYGTCDFNSVMSKRNTGYDSLTFGTYILDINNKMSTLRIHNKKRTIFDLDLPKF